MAWRTKNVPERADHERQDERGHRVDEAHLREHEKDGDERRRRRGTSRHARTVANAAPRPANRSFASAYPAGRASAICAAAMSVAIATVIAIVRPTGNAANTSRYAPKVEAPRERRRRR